jgi:soluble lytic murein transglycosylase-like protein
MVRPMTFRPWCAGLACGLVFLFMGLSDGQAAVYGYTDNDGVFHVTNVVREPALSGATSAASQVTLSATGSSAKPDRGYDSLIREAAEYYSLPVALVKAVVAAESAFNPAAISPADAHGLMQLRPRTAAAMSVQQIHDPRDNIFGGARYLRLLINQFNGNVQLALAAYNAGPSAVERVGGIPPFPETIRYVERVLRFHRQYQ